MSLIHNAEQMDEINARIIDGIKTFFRNAYYNRAVIGLSGGADSALVAYYAVKALGYENVILVKMPSKFTSKESSIDADKLIEMLITGANAYEIPIQKMYDTTINQLDEDAGFSKGKFTVANENLQARLRAVLLMFIANKRHGIVLNTGNKSEGMMGYFTIYGDSIGALAPIGDLYKTDVIKLMKHANETEKMEIIPNNVIQKHPSAELRFNQKDSNDMPEYKILDIMLEEINGDIPEGSTKKYMIEDSLFKDIKDRVSKASFKSAYVPEKISLSDIFQKYNGR